MEAFDEVQTLFPLDLGNPLSVLSLTSASLDLTFINYFHRNKYITYPVDEQEAWQLEKDYVSQKSGYEFFS